ncbi:MAG: Asp23/Gls24 family envelope stress response protein [Clostridia bacterium]|nr:Asp23/Gls24 family envelope stress response protein [Loktanella sp.]MBQ1950035.1 Asp23/Gls24 family envelope stress response protein [Clostridia bacterium]
MDVNEFKTAEGSCIISEDVIASIACTAAVEIPGVAGMANRPVNIRGIMSTNAAARSVRVLNTEDETVLDVYVNLKQGAKIQETAAQVQQAVKVAVQSMTGKPVTRINVHVEGMTMEEKDA